jgi:hypothetical protein
VHIDYKTRRQEKMRATRGIQSSYNIFTCRINLVVSANSSLNLLNPEHEATGRVPWVSLDKIVQIFLLLRLGASTLGSYERNFHRSMEIFILQGGAGKPDILQNNWFAKNPIYIKHTSEQRFVFMVLITASKQSTNIHYI